MGVKRRLFTLAAGVSLLLCLATAGLWVRSHFQTDSLAYVRRSYDGPNPFLRDEDPKDGIAWAPIWQDRWGIYSAAAS
jgi:hypothetical protein